MQELKDIVAGIRELFPGLIGLAGLLEEGVMRPDPALPDESSLILSRVRRLAYSLCRELTGTAAEDPSAFRYISLPGHMERICDHFENLSGLLKMKAAQDIQFSDKAADEMHCLFERLKDMLSSASGRLSRDVSGAGNVREAWLAMLRNASDSAALHEERLREGICLPKTHALYMDLMEEIKAIAWHVKRMARDLPAA